MHACYGLECNTILNSQENNKKKSCKRTCYVIWNQFPHRHQTALQIAFVYTMGHEKVNGT